MTEERKKEIMESLDSGIQFLSPNEPLVEEGVKRIIGWIEDRTNELKEEIGVDNGQSISLWD
jgi:hypothetical protein